MIAVRFQTVNIYLDTIKHRATYKKNSNIIPSKINTQKIENQKLSRGTVLSPTSYILSNILILREILIKFHM